MVLILHRLYTVRVQDKLRHASIYIFLDVLNAKHNYNDCLEILYADIIFVLQFPERFVKYMKNRSIIIGKVLTKFQFLKILTVSHFQGINSLNFMESRGSINFLLIYSCCRDDILSLYSLGTLAFCICDISMEFPSPFLDLFIFEIFPLLEVLLFPNLL